MWWHVTALALCAGVGPACGDSRSSGATEAAANSGAASTGPAAPGVTGGTAPGATGSLPAAPATTTSAAGAAPSSSSAPTTASTSLAGPPSAPGEPIPIPYAPGFEIRPPRGWQVEANGIKGIIVLRPPAGSAVVMVAGAEKGSAVALRELQFMDVSTTGAATFEPDQRDVPIGESGLPADVARGQGYRFLPKVKETHILVRAIVPIRDSKGVARSWLTAFGRWNAGEPELEAAVREAFRGIRLSP